MLQPILKTKGYATVYLYSTKPTLSAAALPANRYIKLWKRVSSTNLPTDGQDQTDPLIVDRPSKR